ncbi:hypothetical protein SHDE107825_16980 [Shewanella denitrificans]|jgi:hypothetical protein
MARVLHSYDALWMTSCIAAKLILKIMLQRLLSLALARDKFSLNDKY